MIRLTKINASKNESRYHLAQVVPSLFGDWGLLREWGRIGQPGTVRQVWFKSRREAEASLKQLREKKEKSGYRVSC